MKIRTYNFIIMVAVLLMVFSCKTAQKVSDDNGEEGEISNEIPSDIVALMETIPGFNKDRDIYDISTISGWFTDDGKPYGLVEAEIVNFEWENYSGVQKKSMYRDFDGEKKYSDYLEWLKALNKVNNLVTVNINPNTKNTIISLSKNLNFPVKFSYKLEFDGQIIYNSTNNECAGFETIPADFLEEVGLYKLQYSLDGLESAVTFIIKK